MNLSPKNVDKKMDTSEHKEPGRWAADEWRTDGREGRFMDGSVCLWVVVGWMRTWGMEMGGGWVHQQGMNGVIGQWTVAICMRVKSQACPSMLQTKRSSESKFFTCPTQPEAPPLASTSDSSLPQGPAPELRPWSQTGLVEVPAL